MGRTVQKFNNPMCMFAACWRSNKVPPDFSCEPVSFGGLFSTMLSAFFFWWFHCWKRPPSVVLMCWLAVLSSRKLWRALWKNIHTENKLHSGVAYSAAGHELNASESSVSIKLLSNINTYDTSMFRTMDKNIVTRVVQWLTIHLAMQGTWVWSLVTELRSHRLLSN